MKRRSRLYKVTIEQKQRIPFRDKPETIARVLSVMAYSKVEATNSVKKTYSGKVVKVEAGKIVDGF
jgi:hypothetical protein